MVAALIVRVISDATMLGFIMRLYLALEPWENKSKLELIKHHCGLIKSTIGFTSIRQVK